MGVEGKYGYGCGLHNLVIVETAYLGVVGKYRVGSRELGCSSKRLEALGCPWKRFDALGRASKQRKRHYLAMQSEFLDRPPGERPGK
jgi:hypothetical protein